MVMYGDNIKNRYFYLKSQTYYDSDGDQTERVKWLGDDLSGAYTAKRSKGAPILSRRAARWKNLDYSIYLHLVARPPALSPHFPHFSFVFGTRSVFGLHSTTYIRLPCKFFRLSTVRFSRHGFRCEGFRRYDLYIGITQIMFLVIE